MAGRQPGSAAGTRALDLACGTGRNALWLARLGFNVDALDISEVAIESLQGVTGVNARAVDLECEPLPIGGYDVVVMINYLQRDLFASAAAALAPGGVLRCQEGVVQRSGRPRAVAAIVAQRPG